MTTATVCSVRQHNLPKFGLLALAISLAAYICCLTGVFDKSACLVGLVLMVTGVMQVFTGVRYQNQGRSQSAATFLPFGIFWLSIIGYQVFPRLGFGQAPSAIAMFSYLSLWGLFVAILFLGSFRENLATQFLYGSLMMCLLALAADQLRTDVVFLGIGAGTGFFAAFSALYISLAQLLEERFGREILPLGDAE